ncbi:hypothetical protein GC163_10465 [bacterium]|nr:hypothetical protein [bacterium]
MKLNAKTLIIAGVVVIAMALEAAIIFFVMPPKGSAVNASEQNATEEVKEDEELEEDPTATDEFAEVLIDSFNCTNNRVAPGSVIHLSFKVIGIVRSKQKLAFEEAANRTHKTRVRQSIERIARSSSLEDLNDPNLSTLKRLVREETNKILGKSYVTEIVINDFRMLEQ